ncbi:hypothetical protein JW933_03635 [candidate division FCPU426 bacterium]|nr:hypothetical protein [candidate division FCPU426 bacterium]
MSAIKLDRKGIIMLGYGIVDVEITRNNVWQAVIEPIKDGQYSRKLKQLLKKNIAEPEARSIYQEILNYKWLQTENLVKVGKLEAGSSLTLQEAALEWMKDHYPAWKAARPTSWELSDHSDERDLEDLDLEEDEI